MRSNDTTKKSPLSHRYTPDDVLGSVLHCLHRDFTFVKMFAHQGDPLRDPIHFFIFQRPDGKKILYSPTIRDSEQASGPDASYPTLNEWLAAYYAAHQTGISLSEITIVPIVQIQMGRKHFNTLLLTSDKDSLHVSIIEPRGNNLTKSLFPYPVAALLSKIKKFFKEKESEIKSAKFCEGYTVLTHNPKIGTQAFYDDTTCGAQHVGFVEAITHLPAAKITDQAALKTALAATNLNRRRDDFNRSRNIWASPPEAEGQGRVNIYDENLQKVLLPANIKKELPHKQSIQKAIAEITTNYTESSSYKNQTFNLFWGHTRQKTAQRIVEKLMELSADDSLTNRLKAAMLLLCCFQTLNTTLYSRFRESLAHALAHLLDCHLEFEKAHNRLLDADREVTFLFYNRLRTMSGDTGTGIDDAVGKQIHAKMKGVNALDGSFAYKFASEEKRAQLDAIQDMSLDRAFSMLDSLIKPNQHHSAALRSNFAG